jgi:hypothetical protein
MMAERVSSAFPSSSCPAASEAARYRDLTTRLLRYDTEQKKMLKKYEL